MRILIVGAGVVGNNLALELSGAGHDVSIVDKQAALIRRIRDRMDVLAVRGNGAEASVLRQAGIETAEMLIAVTNIDEVNLVICMMARHYGVKHKIARLRNDEYTEPDSPLVPSDLGIDTAINPESIITQNLQRILQIPGSLEVASFAGDRVLLASFEVDEGAPVAGKKLLELRDLTTSRSFLVVAIFRGEVSLVPRGDDQIRAGDHVVVLARAGTIGDVVPLVQKSVRQTERVVIYGASLVGRRLAASLQRQLERVVLIEPDAEAAEEAAAALDQVLVLHGEASDPDVLAEADAGGCDAFLSLSRDDEANLLAGLMARRLGAPRLAILTQEPHYVPILTNIGIDVVLNPRLVTVSEILRFIRKGQVHTVTRLSQSEAEVMELEATAGSKITRKPLKEIEFPAGSIIGAVLREGDMLIPDGDCQVAAGETVVVFALPEAIKKIGKLFSRRSIL